MTDGSDDGTDPVIKELVNDVTETAEASDAKAKVTAKTFGNRTFITVTAETED